MASRLRYCKVTMSESQSITGGCLCGKVSLKIHKFDRDVVACHCRQCRKQTGHYYAATRAENEHLRISGEENLSWYKASADAERGFCRHCGSFLLWRRIGSSHTSIGAGCLDAPTGLKLVSQIYTDDKGDYYDLDLHIPSFGGSD